MKIVSAYRMPGFVSRPELEGKTANSFLAIAKHLTEGDHVTVEVSGKGYKEVSIQGGDVYVQRNYAYEY
jgi:hypothetical protein